MYLSVCMCKNSEMFAITPPVPYPLSQFTPLFHVQFINDLIEHYCLYMARHSIVLRKN